CTFQIQTSCGPHLSHPAHPRDSRCRKPRTRRRARSRPPRRGRRSPRTAARPGRARGVPRTSSRFSTPCSRTPGASTGTRSPPRWAAPRARCGTNGAS
ncbi:hypothetical protein FA09DRAFT_361269, partial [Tilletiopsis washingtonensis]